MAHPKKQQNKNTYRTEDIEMHILQSDRQKGRNVAKLQAYREGRRIRVRKSEWNKVDCLGTVLLNEAVQMKLPNMRSRRPRQDVLSRVPAKIAMLRHLWPITPASAPLQEMQHLQAR